jgi:hypothetical protein
MRQLLSRGRQWQQTAGGTGFNGSLAAAARLHAPAKAPTFSLISYSPSIAAAARGMASGRSWDDVLSELSSLITFKTRADGKGWRDAFENMPVYLEVRDGARPGNRDSAGSLHGVQCTCCIPPDSTHLHLCAAALAQVCRMQYPQMASSQGDASYFICSHAATGHDE